MKKTTIDANSAVAEIAYKMSQVIPIYPITPSSPMAEYCDSLLSRGTKNIFDEIPTITELQSESGVAGTLHGSLSAGAMSTTFTSSQGLLLMIPNMFKISAEGLPCVIHVAARAIATHALSIFGDHSDVMAARSTGFIMLCSNNVQEAHDFALISHILTYKANLGVLHFFDGFRTSHEIQKIDLLTEDEIKKLLPVNEIQNFKNKRMTSSSPYQKGTAQNPDVFFQNREAINPIYNNIYQKTIEVLNEFEKLTNRKYSPYEYYGCENPENLIVVMGSAADTIEETLDSLKDEKTGLIKVRLYRPFFEEEFIKTIPSSVKNICVIDRTKEPGANEPLFQDVATSLIKNNKNLNLIRGRYGLGGKEFTPYDVKAILNNFENGKKEFTVGIQDDITNLSLSPIKFNLNNLAKEIKFYGLGSDGTISASKSTIKIIGDLSENYVQGYFEYDSKKSGSLTISHIRLSSNPIKSRYLVKESDIISINNFSFVHKYDCLEGLKENGIVIMNSIFNNQEIDKVLPDSYKKTLIEKNATLYIINAQKIAKEVGLNNKINTIMETVFFKVSNILDYTKIKDSLIKSIKTTFAKKGQEIIDKNINAIEKAENSIEKVDISLFTFKNIQKSNKDFENNFYRDIMSSIEKLKGNDIPVSKFDKNGIIPTDTSKFDKRGIANELPVWKCENCIQCGQCVIACPHNAISSYLIKEEDIDENDKSLFIDAMGMKGYKFKIQISPEDCTGCGICANTCPAIKKALEMKLASEEIDKKTLLDIEKINYKIVSKYKTEHTTPFSTDMPKGLQFNKSYFGFSGACAGCGETPYIKLATMLFGEKMVIANATGCSSIYSGSFPSCPFFKDENGKGPAWANSLFEDNAEFGYGLKLGSKYHNTNESVWIIGGDGWAYDIGYGGLDHVLSSNENVNILVLDSEVYSNTGGQSSKSTQRGSMAKFSSSGKVTKKKDLVSIAIANKNCYVAQVSLGANMIQCIKAFKEAEAYNGPSIIIAYSPCVNHGINMSNMIQEMKNAVECGYWNLVRFNPENKELKLDSKPNFDKFIDFLDGEGRFHNLKEIKGEEMNLVFEKCKQDAIERYENLLNQIK